MSYETLKDFIDKEYKDKASHQNYLYNITKMKDYKGDLKNVKDVMEFLNKTTHKHQR